MTKSKEIPIRKGVEYKEPEKPTALSWKEVLPYLLKGKKCRRLEWDEDLYIKRHKNGYIYYHCTDCLGDKIAVAWDDIEDAYLDETYHDWIVIDKKK